MKDKIKEEWEKVKKEKPDFKYYEIECEIKKRLNITKFVSSAEIQRIRIILNDILKEI